jgi:Flp pilus assembly protein TadG
VHIIHIPAKFAASHVLCTVMRGGMMITSRRALRDHIMAVPGAGSLNRAKLKNPFVGRRVGSYRCSGGEGQSLVEFALVLPVLLLIITAIYSLGLFMLNYQTLIHAVDQGGIALELLPNMPASGTYPGATDPCLTVAQAVVGSSGTLVKTGTNGIQLTVTIGSNSYGPSAPANSSGTANFSCTDASAYAVQGATGTVKATYPCNISIYGIPFNSSCQISWTSSELM